MSAAPAIAASSEAPNVAVIGATSSFDNASTSTSPLADTVDESSIFASVSLVRRPPLAAPPADTTREPEIAPASPPILDVFQANSETT